jgi:hypothetical protein
MTNNSRKQQTRTRQRQTKPLDSPNARADTTSSETHGVTSIERFLRDRRPNKRPTRAPEIKLTKENIRLLSRPHKQAALLALILSDDVPDDELEAMIETALSQVSRRRG